MNILSPYTTNLQSLPHFRPLEFHSNFWVGPLVLSPSFLFFFLFFFCPETISFAVMLFSHLACGLASAALAVASPMVQVLEHRYAAPDPDRWLHVPDGDEGPSMLPRARLEERDVSKSLNISKRWQNKKLFTGQVFAMPPKDDKHNNGNTGIQKTVKMKLICVDCWTVGDVKFGLTMGNMTEKADDEDEDDDSFKDRIKDAFKDVAQDITHLDVFNPVLRIDLSNVEVYAHLKMSVNGAIIYQWRLWTLSATPFTNIPGWLKIGPSAALDLIFVAAAAIDVESGFHMKLPPDAFLELDVRDGNIINQLV